MPPQGSPGAPRGSVWPGFLLNSTCRSCLLPHGLCACWHPRTRPTPAAKCLAACMEPLWRISPESHNSAQVQVNKIVACDAKGPRHCNATIATAFSRIGYSGIVANVLIQRARDLRRADHMLQANREALAETWRHMGRSPTHKHPAIYVPHEETVAAPPVGATLPPPTLAVFEHCVL